MARPPGSSASGSSSPRPTGTTTTGERSGSRPPEGVQETLVEAAPDRFFRPPYVGGRGWLGVYLDVPVDWGELEARIVDAYRLIAPRRLAALV